MFVASSFWIKCDRFIFRYIRHAHFIFIPRVKFVLKFILEQLTQRNNVSNFRCNFISPVSYTQHLKKKFTSIFLQISCSDLENNNSYNISIYEQNITKIQLPDLICTYSYNASIYKQNIIKI